MSECPHITNEVIGRRISYSRLGKLNLSLNIFTRGKDSKGRLCGEVKIGRPGTTSSKDTGGTAFNARAAPMPHPIHHPGFSLSLAISLSLSARILWP